jgi:hypothetical protein
MAMIVLAGSGCLRRSACVEIRSVEIISFAIVKPLSLTFDLFAASRKSFTIHLRSRDDLTVPDWRIFVMMTRLSFFIVAISAFFADICDSMLLILASVEKSMINITIEAMTINHKKKMEKKNGVLEAFGARL